MRILASIHLYPPVHNCGSEWMLHNIFKYLISKGHHCRVILHQSEMHKIQCPYIYEGVEVFAATGHVDAYMWADVIITHLDYTQYTLMMARTVNRPCVHFVHNDIPYSSIQGSFAKTFIVYNSEWIAKKLAYKWPSIVLPPPCDVEYYDTSKNDLVGMIPTRGLVAQLSDSPVSNRQYITLISLNKNKGAEIFYSIAAAMPNKKFIGVVGSYDAQTIIEMPNVTLVENSPDILATYRKTRILLMPSAYESWGRTATEAMCSGIPVICTPTPGLKENCGDAAIYVGTPLETSEPGEPAVDRGSVADWVKAIRRLDDPKEYAKYSVLCKARAKSLDPQKDLENFEAFLYKAVYEK